MNAVFADETRPRISPDGDAVAFELHKKASHNLEFNDAISGMVNKKIDPFAKEH